MASVSNLAGRLARLEGSRDESHEPVEIIVRALVGPDDKDKPGNFIRCQGFDDSLIRAADETEEAFLERAKRHYPAQEGQVRLFVMEHDARVTA